MTQRSVIYLKGRFETGDVPTQIDYGDVLDSFVNLEASAMQVMSGPLSLSYVSAGTMIVNSNNMAVSAGPGTQAGGTILSKDVNCVFGNDILGFGVVAASATPGRIQHIINTSTTVLTVFPSSGCNFIGSAANGSIVLAKNSTMILSHVSGAYGVTRGTI